MDRAFEKAIELTNKTVPSSQSKTTRISEMTLNRSRKTPNKPALRVDLLTLSSRLTKGGKLDLEMAIVSQVESCRQFGYWTNGYFV